MKRKRPRLVTAITAGERAVIFDELDDAPPFLCALCVLCG